MPDEQLQIDFTTPRPGSCAPDCGHCTDPCPWGDPNQDSLSFGQWMAILPKQCTRVRKEE